MKQILLMIALVTLVGCGKEEVAQLRPNQSDAPPQSEKSKQASGELQLHAFYGRLEGAKQAIAAGADVNSISKSQGNSALHSATKGKYVEIVKLLISNGADVNTRVEKTPHQSWQVVVGSTPLHYAVAYGSVEMAQWTYDRRDRNSRETAAKQIIEMLLSKGADVNAMINGKQTPLDAADNELSDLLRKHGGKTAKELKAEVK